jgi:hypothetical protein
MRRISTLILALVASVSFGQTIKFSALPAASALGGTEAVPMVQGGSNVKSTPSAFATYFASQLDSATIISKWTGTCSASTFLKGDGSCASALSTLTAPNIYGLWSGTCSSSTYLRGDGVCGTPAGGGSSAGATDELQIADGAGGFLGAHGTTASNNIIYSRNAPGGVAGNENNLVFASGGIRGTDSTNGTTAVGIGIHGGDNTSTGQGGTMFIRGGNSVSGTGGGLTIGPGIGGGANGQLTITGIDMTGSQTATFSATNKPGSGTTAPSKWINVVINSTNYYIPLWQ